MNWRPSGIALAALLLVALAIVLTRRDPLERGSRIFPEMADSIALEPQRSSDILPAAHRARPNVPGTIPRGYHPFEFENTEEDRERAGLDLANPFPPSLATMERGQEVYRNSCQHCHGLSGRGDGGVAKRVSTFAMSIVGKATADAPDGKLFHIMTYGQNNMPPHAVQVPPDDRWKLIHYLRDLQHG